MSFPLIRHKSTCFSETTHLEHIMYIMCINVLTIHILIWLIHSLLLSTIAQHLFCSQHFGRYWESSNEKHRCGCSPHKVCILPGKTDIRQVIGRVDQSGNSLYTGWETWVLQESHVNGVWKAERAQGCQVKMKWWSGAESAEALKDPYIYGVLKRKS